MIDHMGFRVRDLAVARCFYEACASAIGLAVIDNSPEFFLIGPSASKPLPFVWVGTAQPAFWTPAHSTSSSPIHLAFQAADRAAVEAFHRAGLAAGGKDNGAPGPRGPAAIKVLRCVRARPRREQRRGRRPRVAAVTLICRSEA